MVNRYYFSDGHVEEDYVTEIVAGRFKSNTELVRVDAPLVESVGGDGNIFAPNGAFYRCKYLIDINLPNAISIGSFVFQDCLRLTSIDLPKVNSFGSSVFLNCGSTHLFLDGYTHDSTYLWAVLKDGALKYLRVGLTSTEAGTTTAPRVTKDMRAETVVLPSLTTMGNYMFGASSVANANQYIKRVCAANLNFNEVNKSR